MNNMETFSFDPADFLDDPEVVVEYLTLALSEDDPSVFQSAFEDVARSRGLFSIYSNVPFEKHHLYPSLTSDAKPFYNVVSSIVQGLDFSCTHSALALGWSTSF